MSKLSKLVDNLPEIKEYKKEKSIRSALFSLLLFGGETIISKLILLFWITDLVKWFTKKTPKGEKKIKTLIKKLKSKSDFKDNFFLSFAHVKKKQISWAILPTLIVPSVLFLKITGSLSFLTSLILITFLFFIYLKINYGKKQQKRVKNKKSIIIIILLNIVVIAFTIFTILYTHYLLLSKIDPVLIVGTIFKLDYITMWELRAQFLLNFLPEFVTQNVVVDWRFSFVSWLFLMAITFYFMYFIINIITKLAEKSDKDDMKYMTLIPDVLTFITSLFSVVFFSFVVSNILINVAITVVIIVILYTQMLKNTIKFLKRDEKARNVQLTDLFAELSNKLLFKISLGFNIIKAKLSKDKTIDLQVPENGKDKEIIVTKKETLELQESEPIEYERMKTPDGASMTITTITMKKEKRLSPIFLILSLLLSGYIVLRLVDYYMLEEIMMGNQTVNIGVNIFVIVISSMVYANLFSLEPDYYKKELTTKEKKKIKAYTLLANFSLMATFSSIFYYFSLSAKDTNYASQLLYLLIIFTVGMVIFLLFFTSREFIEKECKLKYGLKEDFFKINSPFPFVCAITGVELFSVFVSFLLIFLLIVNLVKLKKNNKKEFFSRNYATLKSMFNTSRLETYSSIILLAISLPILLIFPLILLNLQNAMKWVHIVFIAFFLVSTFFLTNLWKTKKHKSWKFYLFFVFSNLILIASILTILVIESKENLFTYSQFVFVFFKLELSKLSLSVTQVFIFFSILSICLTILLFLLILSTNITEGYDFRKGLFNIGYSSTDVLIEYIFLIGAPMLLSLFGLLFDTNTWILSMICGLMLNIVLISIILLLRNKYDRSLPKFVLPSLMVILAITALFFFIFFSSESTAMIVALVAIDVAFVYFCYQWLTKTEFKKIKKTFKEGKDMWFRVVEIIEMLDQHLEIFEKNYSIWRYSIFVTGLKNDLEKNDALLIEFKDYKKRILEKNKKYI
jgi:hypothetical protein